MAPDKRRPQWLPRAAVWGEDAVGFGAGAEPSAVPGAGGAGLIPLGPPYGTSTECGDAIVGPDEECDDGDDGAPDACTGECQTRDQAVLADPADGWSSRYLGAGRHPVAGLSNGFITAYVDASSEEPRVGATIFDIWGRPSHVVTVSDGAFPIYDANPVAAALPNGDYAVAWSDVDGDGSDLGVALRRVTADGALGSLGVANQATQFSQLDPDLVWTGTELVAAWVDFGDAANGPDIRYRKFDASLSPLGGDWVLAGSAAPESAVALASFNGGWAAAYREGLEDGTENEVVKVGDATFRVGPVLGGPIDDKPALVELDETHLLLVFSAGTDPGMTGPANVPRLRYSVIDTEGTSAPGFQALDPLDDLLTLNTAASHLSPAAARGLGGVYVAWRSEALPSDVAGDQLWLKYLSWDAASATLEVREQETLIPRTCEGSIGDQRRPALAYVDLPPKGALATAWDDYSHSQGVYSGDPDVVVQYAPLHEWLPEDGSVFEERFTGVNGADWSSHWSRETYGAGTMLQSIQDNEGEVHTSSGGGGVLMRVNDHNALNIVMAVDVRFDLNSARGAFIARRDDADPDTYLAIRFGIQINTKWEIYAVIDGATTVIAEQAMPSMFTLLAQDIDYHMQGRVETLPNGDLALSGRFWEIDTGEAGVWTLAATLSSTSTGALGQVYSKFANRSGRFGLLASLGQTGRTTTFDDFKAVYYEGSYAGNLDAVVDAPAPLLRRAPAYRVCTAEMPCVEAQGCCLDDAECGA